MAIDFVTNCCSVTNHLNIYHIFCQLLLAIVTSRVTVSLPPCSSQLHRDPIKWIVRETEVTVLLLTVAQTLVTDPPPPRGYTSCRGPLIPGWIVSSSFRLGDFKDSANRESGEASRRTRPTEIDSVTSCLVFVICATNFITSSTELHVFAS